MPSTTGCHDQYSQALCVTVTGFMTTPMAIPPMTTAMLAMFIMNC